MYILLILSVFSFYTHAESFVSEQTQSRIINDSSVAVNGPIYIVSNSNVETINYPNLEFINGPIYIINNTNLTTVRFPKLKFVNGPIYITYNASLEITYFFDDMYVNGPIYYYMNKFK